ncbi:MAG: type II secretion system F family protein [Pseudobacteriovorax sp.]|nr:type II secretion system F family protein [Pseudobacteriovorax sp.]
MWIAEPIMIYVAHGLVSLGGILIAIYFQRRILKKKKSKSSQKASQVSSHQIDYDLIRKNGLIFALISFPLMVLVGFPLFLSVIITGGLTFLLPWFLARKAKQDLYEAFDESMPDSLAGIASSLKAGLTIQKAMEVAVKSTPEVFAKEIDHSLKEYHLGVPIDDALNNIRLRIPTTSSNMAFGAIVIGRKLGGPLPQILARVAETIRKRLEVEGKLKALTAQGRAQGAIICSAPVLVFFGLAFMSKDKFQILTDTPAGQILLSFCIILWLVGMAVTWRVMQLEV